MVDVERLLKVREDIEGNRKVMEASVNPNKRDLPK